MNPRKDTRRRQVFRPGGGLLFYVVVLMLIFGISYLFGGRMERQDLAFSEVIEQLRADNVEEAVVSGTRIELRLKEGVGDNQSRLIQKDVSPYWMSRLMEELDAAASDGKLLYDYDEPTNLGMWINVVLSLLMFGAMAFFIWMMYSRQSGDGRSAMNFGRSRARAFDPSANKVTFADVAGADEEKHELEEVVDFLKRPDKYTRLGAKIPRGILLVGPPGTGKTLLARAVAGEAGVPFYSISGSDFVEMFVGVGASRVRDLFETAKKNSPSIIFIDEIDAVGRQRGAGMGGSHDEREQTLNQLLVEMDGFGPNEDAIIMAATNRPDILDPALLRPGRFDRRVTVMRPDIKGREEILEVHAKGKKISADIDFKEVARATPGFTGADLANLLNEAALLAARSGKDEISYRDISDSVFKVMLGPEKKSRVMSKKERDLTAWHEAGHALVLRTVSDTNRVERVSIIPAGNAGGYTAHKPHDDLYYTTKKQLLNDIRISMGGRAAEEIIFGEVSTGAASDLQTANDIARDMVKKYGMSQALPNLVFDDGSGEVFLGRDYGQIENYSDGVAELIDREVKEIIDTSYNDALEILRDKSQALKAVTDALLEKEKIEGYEFEEIYMANTTEEQRANDAENPGRDEEYFQRLADVPSIPITP